MQHPARTLTFDEILDGMQAAIAERHVRAYTDGVLQLYTYTEQCVHGRAWNAFTRMARGLIVDTQQKAVVATPFVKFFNLHELEESLPDQPFETFEKMDGSLIILFYHDGTWRTATKGHLSSPQARWAAEWIRQHDLSHLDHGTTYLLEAIYPENKIVIEYEQTGLCLLAAYNAEGYEIDYTALKNLSDTIGWEIAARHSYTSLSDLIDTARALPAHKEGFIIRYPNGYRVKIKGEEYCRIHRLISNCTPLFMWEYLNDPDALVQIRRDLPEEFWQDFDSIISNLEKQRTLLQDSIRALAESVAHLSDKDLGLTLQNLPENLRGYIFPYRKSGQDFNDAKLREIIWRRIRPVANKLPGYQPSANLYRVASEDT